MPKVITPSNKIKEVSDHIFNDKQSMTMLGFKPFVEPEMEAVEPLPQPDPIVRHEVKAEPPTFSNDIEEPVIEKKAPAKKKTSKRK